MKRPITPEARGMFAALEMQINREASRQRGLAIIRAQAPSNDTGIAQQQQGKQQWQTQHELKTGISSILDAFSRRESSQRAKNES